MSATSVIGGSIHVAPFPFNEYVEAAVDFDRYLGMEIDAQDPEGIACRWRCVKLNATTATTPQYKTFKWTSRTAFTVEAVDATTDLPCGVGHPSMSSDVPVSGTFWLQIEGDVEVKRGDDGTAISAGDQCGPDDDATPKGMLKKNTVDDMHNTVFIAIDAAANVDTVFTARIQGRLNG